jgi:hypothetical protein
LGSAPVDFVDGDDQGHFGGAGVFDGLDGLRHHAVIGGDHQNHDVGHAGAAGAHGGEGLVAGGVDEGDLVAGGRGHLVGADVLGDAAGLAGRDVGFAQGVQQAGLAVVDMAHDGDDRRAGQQVRVGVSGAFEADFHVRVGDAAGAVAEFGDDQFGGVGVDRLGDGGHHAELHQRLHHLIAAGGHAVGEFLDGDGFRQDHLADHLHAVGTQQFEFRLAPFAFALAADAGERADFFVLALQGRLHVDFAGAAMAVAEFFRRDNRHAALGGDGGAGAAQAGARGFVVVVHHHRAGAAGFQAQGLGGGGGGGDGGAHRWLRGWRSGGWGRGCSGGGG